MYSFGREDVFRKVRPNVWEGVGGRFGTLRYDGSASASLRMPRGTTLTFAVRRIGGAEIVGQLIRITSSQGNQIQITLGDPIAGSSATTPRPIRSVTDSFGRQVRFAYDDAANPARLTRIVDFAGRGVSYAYDSAGRLESVTSPTIRSTGGLNDFPQGKKTRYTYTSSGSIEKVFSPRDSGDRPRLSFSYYTTDDVPANPDVSGVRALARLGIISSRVKSFTTGDPAATSPTGGTTGYAYELHFVGPDGSNGGVASVGFDSVTTEITDPRGTRLVEENTNLGHLLGQTVELRGLRPNDRLGNTIESTVEVSLDGLPLVRTDPNGIQNKVEWGSGSRAAEAVPVSIETLPAPGKPVEQNRLRSETEYEPVFQRPYKIKSPRGFAEGRVAAFTTTFVYDYMEDLEGTIASLVAPGWDEAQLRREFDARGIRGLGDVNGDGVTSQRAGNVVQIVHPTVTLPAEASRAGLARSQSAVETFAFNQFGQRTRHVDVEGNVTRWEYYPARDPDGDGEIDVPGGDSATGGFLRRVIADAETGAGRNSGTGPAPVEQVTQFGYAAVGSFPANRRGVPTVVTDPRGVEHHYLVNEHDQVVKEVAAAEVRAATESGLRALAYETVTIYDANGKIVEKRIEDRDGVDGEQPPIVHRFSYDKLDRKSAERWDVGGLEIEHRFTFDENGNLVSKIRGAGSPSESTTRYAYDERNLLMSATRGAGTREAATTRNEVDQSGNVVLEIDADGDVAETVLDGYDRARERIDREGMRTLTNFDAASNPIRVRRIGRVSGPGTPDILLSESFATFDERNRSQRQDRRLFQYPGQLVGPLDAGALAARNPSPQCGSKPCVSRIWVHDRLGRMVAEIDAEDDTTLIGYDGLSRTIERIDAAGNVVSTVYDDAGNAIAGIEAETSALISEPELFQSSFRYDALGRQIQATEPNGSQTRWAYDSRGQRVSRTDALGNVTEWRYDRVGRPIESARYLAPLARAGEPRAAGGATPNAFDATQGGGDGVIRTLRGYDALSRLITQTDDRLQTTVTSYDALDRRVAVFHPDQTADTWTYTADGELDTHATPNGSVERWKHDAESRPLEVEIDNTSAPEVLGTKLRRWSYDGLGRVTSFDDNGAGPDVGYAYLYDSLSRKLRETQSIAGLPELRTDVAWRGADQRASLTYPSGRTVLAEHDSLDREISLSEGDGDTPIASYSYVGTGRLVTATLGNGTSLDLRNASGTQTFSGTGRGYDEDGRPVFVRWERPGARCWRGTAGSTALRTTCCRRRVRISGAAIRTPWTAWGGMWGLPTTCRSLRVARSPELRRPRSLLGVWMGCTASLRTCGEERICRP